MSSTQQANSVTRELGSSADQSQSRRVCYLVSHGFAARMVLQSDLIPALYERGIHVDVLSPDLEGHEGEAHRDRGLRVLRAHFRQSKISHAQVTELRRYFREPIKENAALWSRHQFNVNSPNRRIRWTAHLMLGLHRIAYRSSLAQRGFHAVDRRVHSSRKLGEQLKNLQPAAVVSTYPVSAFESACLVEAKRLNIPTIGHLLSWDNITCKGRFVQAPDSYVAWGPIMAEELQEHYSVHPERIHSCGVPHFDAHRKLVSPEKLSCILQQLGVQPENRYLFFGMSSPVFAPHEIDIVEELARQIEANRFGAETQLVVRPHPQNVTGNMADTSWLPRLEAIQSDRVALNMPLLAGGRLAWNMEQDDLSILVNLLAGCSICLNSGSTLSIDALMHRKPVIVTFFDADLKLPWWKSARRIKEFPHYQKLLATGGVDSTHSFEELFASIDRCLDRPSDNEEARAIAIERECGEIDGRAADRVANALHRIIEINDS